ncbi:MAG TPA: hypothetical protein VFG23_20860 [Polyangia bacterium]|nr:hypothetical protein [Polyangia bacterium]
MLRNILAISAIALGLLSGRLYAADQSATDALIQQGLELRRDAKPEQALALFQRAHAMAPSPRTFGQMGLVETSLKRWVDANLHLTVSLTSPDDGWVVKNRAFLEQALATTKQHIGDLVVSGPADVEVFVDGKSVGTLPAIPPIHLGEGQVHVSATAPGFKPFDQMVLIRVGVRVQIAITLRPIAVEQAAPVASSVETNGASPTTLAPSPISSRNTWHTWAGASLAVAGAGGLTWGIVWIAIDNHDACGSTQGAACGTAYNTKTPGWILAGVGAAAIASGAVVFFTGHSSPGSNLALGIGPTSLLLRGDF